MTTIYCNRAAVESVIGAPGLLAFIDDDGDGVESPTESAYVSDAIERAAVRLNSQVGRQYKLEDVTANAWMEWANATLAAALLTKRRNNPVPESLSQDVQEITELANEIAWGRRSLPEQRPSAEHSPTVSNFRPELRKFYGPVRVVAEESTGAAPESGVKRETAGNPGPY